MCCDVLLQRAQLCFFSLRVFKDIYETKDWYCCFSPYHVTFSNLPTKENIICPEEVIVLLSNVIGSYLYQSIIPGFSRYTPTLKRGRIYKDKDTSFISKKIIAFFSKLSQYQELNHRANTTQGE